MRRWMVNLALLAVVLPSAPALAQVTCQFTLGFATLRQMVGAGDIGECLTNERFNLANGNAEQATTKGLLVWRKVDNWTAFTNGYETSINGPGGLQRRLNTERFSWEGDVGSFPTAQGSDALVAEALPPQAARPTLSTADVAELIRPSVLLIRTPTGTGSGVRVAQGVLTNAHVVEGHQSVELILPDGRTTTGVVLRVDPTADLALLSSPSNVAALSLSPSRQQRQGDTVVALGYPLGTTLGSSATLTTGILSAFREDEDGVRYIQTDAAINPGNSGGALVNLRGELIGIPTISLRNTQNIGLAIATESIDDFLAGRMLTPSAPPAVPTPRPAPTATPRPLPTATIRPLPTATAPKPRLVDLLLPASVASRLVSQTPSQFPQNFRETQSEPWSGGIEGWFLMLESEYYWVGQTINVYADSASSEVSPYFDRVKRASQMDEGVVAVFEIPSSGPPQSRALRATYRDNRTAVAIISSRGNYLAMVHVQRRRSYIVGDAEVAATLVSAIVARVPG